MLSGYHDTISSDVHSYLTLVIAIRLGLLKSNRFLQDVYVSYNTYLYVDQVLSDVLFSRNSGILLLVQQKDIITDKS